MKKLLCLLSLAIALAGCDSNQKIDKAIASAANSTQRIETIFLGFRFGMTLKEVYEHIYKLSIQHDNVHIPDLIKEDREYNLLMSLIQDPNNCEDCENYFYKRSILNSKYIFTASNGKEFIICFSPSFYEEKLYRMCFDLYSKEGLGFDDKELVYKTYLQAKQKEFKEYYDDYNGMCYSILDNLVIKFYISNEKRSYTKPSEYYVVMDYIDMTTEKKHKEEERGKEEIKIKETLNDFNSD
jgi:hypothetical protein